MYDSNASNSHHALAEDLWVPISKLLERLGRWWIVAPWWILAGAFGLILAVKDGLHFEITNSRQAYLPAAIAFPQPTGYFSASVGNIAIAKALGVTTVGEWLLMHAVLVALSLTVALTLAIRSPLAPRNVVALLLVGSTGAAVLLQTVGKYDPITFVGACTLVLARREAVSYLGAAGMALGNPEQAIVASICLLLLSAIPDFSEWRRIALMSLGISLAIWCGVQTWMLHGGVHVTRLTLLPSLLGVSIDNFLVSPAEAVWSWFGVGWLVILGLVVATRGRSRFLLLVALVLLPALVTLTTADGARVYGLVVLPAFLVAGAKFWTQISGRPSVLNAAVGLILLLVLVAPTTLTGWGRPGQTASASLAKSVDQLR